jgi:hypothetical protein
VAVVTIAIQILTLTLRSSIARSQCARHVIAKVYKGWFNLQLVKIYYLELLHMLCIYNMPSKAFGPGCIAVVNTYFISKKG